MIVQSNHMSLFALHRNNEEHSWNNQKNHIKREWVSFARQRDLYTYRSLCSPQPPLIEKHL